MNEEKINQIALQLVPGIGNANAKHLISYCGSARAVFAKNKNDLLKIPGVGEKTIKSILTKGTFAEAETIYRSSEKNSLSILHYTDPEYPTRLKTLADAPNLLYFTGSGSLNGPRTVAIVGTRKASEYGKAATQNICESLSAFGVTVISGLAYGIDIEAHRKSLSKGMPTIGVIAGGTDRIYPKVHIKTAQAMMEKGGGVLTEQPPGTQPEPHLFPARNRIIAGLADVTIVVEAAESGGALITANIAYSYDKPIFAVPGNLNQSNSAGCNNLIASQKAYIYTKVEDLLPYVAWSTDLNPKTSNRDLIYGLEGAEKKVAEVLIDHPTGIAVDELAWKSQIQINQLAGVLLSLEFKNLVKPLPGKKYRLLT